MAENDDKLSYEQHDTGASNKRQEVVTCSKKKKRSTSPFGRTKRVRWNEEEKTLVYSTFHESITEKKLPTLSRIEKFRELNICMRKRSAAVIKTWIHNQIKKKSCKNEILLRKSDVNVTVNEDIKKMFAKHIRAKTIPTIEECIIAYKSEHLQKFGPIDIQDMILKEIHRD